MPGLDGKAAGASAANEDVGTVVPSSETISKVEKSGVNSTDVVILDLSMTTQEIGAREGQARGPRARVGLGPHHNNAKKRP